MDSHKTILRKMVEAEIRQLAVVSDEVPNGSSRCYFEKISPELTRKWKE